MQLNGRAVLLVAGAATLGVLAWRARNGAFDNLEAVNVALEDAIGMSPAAEALAAIAAEPNVAAALVTIRTGEGTVDQDGYRRLFGGELVTTLADHPRKPVTRLLGGRSITSTAAGAYQILERTWDDVQPVLELPDFSPQAQDVAAVYLIRRRGALADVRAGNFDDAIAKLGREWASLPGSPYGQPTISLARARDVYASAGGAFA